MKNQIEEMAKVICENIDRVDRLAESLYNAGYRKRSEWISVDERLPDEAERVLVYGENGICFANRYKDDWLMPMLYAGEVTHWMPLPEPPMMKGAGNENL